MRKMVSWFTTDFEFVIGREEKHVVHFRYSKVWFTISIEIDGQPVKKRLLPLYAALVAIMFAGAWSAADYHFFAHAVPYRITPVEVGLFLVEPLVIVYVAGLLPVTIVVGENEKHVVRIRRTNYFWNWFSLPLRATFDVRIDDRLFWTFEG